uniref:Uncharacterized protein n=1 Tax=Arundo donax TaxID=35708 RepID=A0A0A8YYQ2_ARUDO
MKMQKDKMILVFHSCKTSHCDPVVVSWFFPRGKQCCIINFSLFFEMFGLFPNL